MQETKKAIGRYLSGYYHSLSPTTKAMEEFVKRGLSTSIMIAPSRMIDEVEKMLESYRENDNDNSMGSTSAKLPMIIIALAKDYSPVMNDYSSQLPSPVFVQLPSDDKKRAFKMRQMISERRVQVAVIAPEEETARSLVAQLNMWVSNKRNRSFYAEYSFAGQTVRSPITIEDNTVMASNVATDHKNLTILTLDFTIRESVPLFNAPCSDQENDGKGSSDADDPNGFRTTSNVVSNDVGGSVSVTSTSDSTSNEDGDLNSDEITPEDMLVTTNTTSEDLSSSQEDGTKSTYYSHGDAINECKDTSINNGV